MKLEELISYIRKSNFSECGLGDQIFVQYSIVLESVVMVVTKEKESCKPVEFFHGIAYEYLCSIKRLKSLIKYYEKIYENITDEILGIHIIDHLYFENFNH